MKLKSVRTTAIVLLFFLGISALLGAVPLIFDPSGEALGLPPEILETIPFKTYLIPAILLGLFNGLLSIIFAILVIRKIRLQGWVVIFQGCVLLVWISAGILMKLYYPPLTITYYIVGILLLISGILILKAVHS